MRRRFRPTLVLLATCAVLSASCGGRTQAPARVDTVRLKLSWFAGPEHAFIFRGIDRGNFADQKIHVDVQEIRGSQESATALEHRAVEFAFVSGDYLVQARHGGAPIKGILTLIHESPVSVSSYESANITAPRDLIGKKLGILPTSATHYQLGVMLRNSGVDSAAIKMEPVGATAIALFQSRKIDAFEYYTNWAPAALRARGEKINELMMRNYGVKAYSSTLATRDDLIQDRHDLVQRFVTAMYESLEQSRSDFAGTLRSLLNKSPALDSFETAASLRKTNELFFAGTSADRPPGYMTAAGWAETQATLRSAGRLPADLDVRFFFDSTFLSSAVLARRAR